MYEDNNVSNRHIPWCRTEWWIRIDDGSIMRSARGRRRGLASSQESGRRGSRWGQGRRGPASIRRGRGGGRNGEGEREHDRSDSAARTHCTCCCTCLQRQQQLSNSSSGSSSRTRSSADPSQTKTSRLRHLAAKDSGPSCSMCYRDLKEVI